MSVCLIVCVLRVWALSDGSFNSEHYLEATGKRRNSGKCCLCLLSKVCVCICVHLVCKSETYRRVKLIVKAIIVIAHIDGQTITKPLSKCHICVKHSIIIIGRMKKRLICNEVFVYYYILLSK